jgi:hypothetical protein
VNGTGSIPTAMRCCCSDAPRPALVALSLLLLASTAGCVKPLVSGEYEPPTNATRLDAEEARDYLTSALAPECRRIGQDGSEVTGEARLTVQVAQSGEVLKSRVTQRSGDARIDELFATTAARMRFEADAARPATYTGRLRMGYSCAPTRVVGTIELF